MIAALLIQTPGSSTVNGRLLASDGTPAVGIRVSALPAPDSSVQRAGDLLLSSGQTDSSGRYHLENLPVGRYYLTAGLIEKPTYYPGTTNVDEATVISIGFNETIEVLNFVLKPVSVPGTGGRRARLELKVTGQLSMDMTQDARASFETLARMAGLNIIFSSRFSAGIASNFHADNVSIFEAFDLLSTKTQHFWEPLDSTTILVGPTYLGRQDLDAQLRLKDALANAGVALPPQLRPSTGGSFSFSVDQQSRKAFETLGTMAGINVVFESGFQSRPVQLKLDNVDLFQALDILSLQDNKFWFPYNDKTIVVAEDGQGNRRNYEFQIVKSIALAEATTLQQTNEILNALRTTHNFRYVFQTRTAIVVRDTPARVALAAKVVSDLNRTTPVIVQADANELFISESGFVRNSKPPQSELQVQGSNAVSITMTEDARKSYETLAQTAGIQVEFDQRFMPGTPTKFHVENIGILDALNLLSLQTGNFWQVTDSRAILVAPDNPTVRTEVETKSVKTVPVKNSRAQEDTMAIVNVLRTVLGMREVSADLAASAIVLRDTPSRLVLAETLIGDLDKP